MTRGTSTVQQVVRRLRRRPMFAAAVIVSIALSVGANTTIFSIVDSLWFRPLPVKDPESLVVGYRRVAASEDGALLDNIQRRYETDLRKLDGFVSVAFEVSSSGLMGEWNPVVRLNLDTQPISSRSVSHDYFQVLGVPIRGSGFNASDDAPGAAPSAIVSRAFWHSALNSDPAVLGRTLSTTRGPLTIIGVVDSDFRGARVADDTDLWLPLGTLGRYSDVAAHSRILPLTPVTFIGRLKNGVTLAQAEAQVRAIAGSSVVLWSLREVPFRLHASGDIVRQRTLFQVLWVAAGLVLVLGCANVSSLLVSAYEERKREYVVRLALGAPPLSIVWIQLQDVFVLTIVGCAVGLCVRWVLLGIVGQLTLPSGVLVGEIVGSVDRRVAGFGCIVALVGGAVASAVAVRQMKSNALTEGVNSAGRAIVGSRLRLRRALLATHVGLSTVLLVSALDVSSDVLRAMVTDVGFDSDHTVFLSVRPRLTQYIDNLGRDEPDRRKSDYRALVDALVTVPGVLNVAYGPALLLATHEPVQDVSLVVDDRLVRLPVSIHTAGPGYLTTIGATFVEGRDLDETDGSRALNVDKALDRMFAPAGTPAPAPPDRAPTAVINEALARSLWQTGSPIGQAFVRTSLGARYEVVGVFRDVRYDVLERAATPSFVTIRPFGDDSLVSGLDLALRLRTLQPASIQGIRTLVTHTFPDPSMLTIESARDIVLRQTATQRLTATMVSTYAVVAVVLGLVGLYGLVRYLIARGRREYATRAALGASPASLRQLICVRATSPVALGLAVGLIVSAITLRAIGAHLMGIEPPSFVIYLCAASVMAGCALIATLVGISRVESLKLVSALAGE